MKTNKILTGIKNVAGKTGLKLRKSAPTIAVVAGVAGSLVGTVLACKATTKLDDILAEGKDNVQKVDDYCQSENRAEAYTDEVAKKDKLVYRVRTAKQVAKLYAPAAAVIAVSYGLIFGSHKAMSGRVNALSAAFATASTTLSEYRQRVREQFGEEADLELLHGKAKEVTQKDPETGEETITIEKSKINNGNSFSRLFDVGNEFWEKNPEYNFLFIRSVQNQLNDRLRKRGYITLNEVYEALGFAPIPAGQLLGWLDNDQHTKYIDFGLMDPVMTQAKRNFLEGTEPSVWLEFNIDGDILNQIR